MEPGRLIHPARRRSSSGSSARKRKRQETPSESEASEPPRKRQKVQARKPAARRGRRDQHSSLRALARRFVQLISRAPDGQADLNETCAALEVPKRRIYDITNVLEGIGLIEKKSKNTIVWKGDEVRFDELQKLIESGGRRELPVELPPRPPPEAVSSPSEIAQTKQILQGLLKGVARLRDDSKRVDSELDRTRTRLRSLTEHHKNYDKAYVTYQDVTSLPGLEDRTIIAIRADPFTTLTVPDPDDTEEEFLFAPPDSGGGLMRSPRKRKKPKRVVLSDATPEEEELPRSFVNPFRGLGEDHRRYQIFLNSPEGDLGTGSVNVYLLSDDIDPTLPPVAGSGGPMSLSVVGGVGVPVPVPVPIPIPPPFHADQETLLMAAKTVADLEMGQFRSGVSSVSDLFGQPRHTPNRLMPASPVLLPNFENEDGEPRTPPRRRRGSRIGGDVGATGAGGGGAVAVSREGSMPRSEAGDDSSVFGTAMPFSAEISIPTPMSPGLLMELPQPKSEPDFVYTLDQAEGVAELFGKEDHPPHHRGGAASGSVVSWTNRRRLAPSTPPPKGRS